ncbi:Chitin-binding type-1 domain-containing protein [Mycena indigotica]|uniref:Chitin-binding type-1 domain-containing protein n=1 Tax=Mycena indigotica TaxID=2126181 RepID=A0A8H6TGH2_9AGAR|nr:Chitin-binding type-1 domain-containing protein [Mycena indigotica]KAF7316287.1 Chitin-binding type-1 domain-containing protein [Mycena indigotica]
MGNPSRHLLLYFVFALVSTVFSQSNNTVLPVGSCTAEIPCSNGACCNGDSGFCGFGPSFCKTVSQGGPCTSNCNALAECGPNAAPANFTCPLSVCCSQFGFCGTTAEFCGAGCQSNCNPPAPRSCGADQQSATQRRIGYYEGWAVTRACSSYPPEMISAETLTHINFAFALIDGSSYAIKEMSPGDAALWTRTTALKKNNVALKVFLSIGGWSFNDPPTSNVFSNLVASAANTAAFINSALQTLQAYGFDGIDVDWEYPAAYDRGGNPADKANFVTFMAKVKAAFKPRNYGLTFTAPSSYWYLQHFDLPGLLQSADWVNVMTYDLHGTWDGTDPYIGPLVLAHTNLTEIEDTLSLFNNVGVDPNKIVLGIGFYGRSFQLADPSCSSPGCVFVGGAVPGACSANSGTLMFSEIETILAQPGVQATFDAAAAVKYVVWNDVNWVSYDDAQTLAMKLQFANSRCLGGTMIWSVDQDDTSYSALKGLYPDIDVNKPSLVESGDQCTITGCGQSCPSGWDTLTTLTTNPGAATSCPSNNPARLCCPSGNAPQNCSWRGGGGSTCNPQCSVGEITIATDPVGGDGKPTCAQGTKAFCCSTGQNDPTGCHATGCGSTSCASGDAFLTFVRQGTEDNGSCEAENSDPNVINKQPCPEICATNNKPVCCEASVISAYTNCGWVGDLPNCLNSACPAGKVAVFDDIQGDASQSCVGKGKRLYCCNPPANEQFLPVPEAWVLPSQNPTPGGFGVIQPASFTVDFDDNIGTPDTNTPGAGTSGESDDGKENDSPFGEVFISSPNPGSVSSLDRASDWVITSCDRFSDQPQEVLAFCSKSMDSDDAGCGHVFIDQAEHTIVKLPSSCGAGPYARIVSLSPHEDQDVLPTHIRRDLPENELVYSLRFDYNFAAIPASNGPILMRADVTDMPGYWDEMINSPPDAGTTGTRRSNSKRDFHQPEELDKRWFGPFDRWLQKLNTVTSSNSISRNFHWSDTYTIFHQEESCPHFTSSLDISVTGNAQANSRFGYYLEATIVPPAIQQSYVYLTAGASAQATFTVSGLAKAQFGTERAEIISFGFPGLYYPGLLTIGPSLHLYGQLSGQLSMSGRYSASVGYTFPSLDLTFGKEDSHADEEQTSNPVSPNSNNNGYDYSFGYNVELSGNVEAHIVPSLQLGVSILGGSLLDAQVFVEADMYAGVGVTGSVSSSVAPQFCVNPYFGVDLNAGLTGSVLFWRDNAISYQFYSTQFPFGGKCFGSQQQASGSSKRDGLITGQGETGSALKLSHRSPYPVYAVYETEAEGWVAPPTLPVASNLTERLEKRGGVPFLPGNLFCPDAGTDITGTDAGSDCYCYSDAGNDPINNALITAKRSVAIDQELVLNGPKNTSFIDGLKVLRSVSLESCSSISIPIPGYDKTPIISYYDLDNPAALNPTMGSWSPQVPVNLGNKKNGEPYLTIPSGGGNKNIYAREHPYEESMVALFIDFLERSPDLWRNTDEDNTWCAWVRTNFQSRPAYNPAAWGTNSLFGMLGTCYPNNAAQSPMVVLEQDANVMKNTAYFSQAAALIGKTAQPLRTNDKFTSYCPQKQIAVLRAAAGIPSFLNEYDISQIFLQQSNCVRSVWSAWQTAYRAATVDAPNRTNVNVPALYDTWVHSVMSNVVPFIRNQLDNLIPLYNGGQTTAAVVDLSWPVLLDQVQFQRAGQTQQIETPASVYSRGVSVTRTDLTNQVRNAIPDLNWLNFLPH